MKKLILWILIIPVILAFAVACGDDDNGKDTSTPTAPAATTAAATASATPLTIDGLKPGETLKIGAILSQSGSLAQVGKVQEDGLKFAIEEINAGGGVGGHNLELVVRDDGGDPTQARNVAQELVEGSGVKIVIGPVLSSSALSALPYLTEKKVPAISFALSDKINDPATFPYGFTVSVVASERGPLVAGFALGFKPTKIGFDSEDTPAGDAQLSQFTAALKNLGFSEDNVVVVKHAQGNTDPQPQITELKNASVDLMISNSQGSDIPRVIRAANELGFSAKILGTEAFILPALVDASGGADAVKNVYAPQYKNLTYAAGAEPDDKDAVAFRDQLTQRFGADGPSELLNYSTVWDMAHLIKAAVEKAGSVDGDAVKQALETIKYEGVRSNYQFSSTRHVAVSGDDFVIVRAGTKVDGFDERVED